MRRVGRRSPGSDKGFLRSPLPRSSPVLRPASCLFWVSEAAPAAGPSEQAAAPAFLEHHYRKSLTACALAYRLPEPGPRVRSTAQDRQRKTSAARSWSQLRALRSPPPDGPAKLPPVRWGECRAIAHPVLGPWPRRIQSRDPSRLLISLSFGCLSCCACYDNRAFHESETAGCWCSLCPLGDSFGSWALERTTQSIKSLACYQVHRVKTVTAHKLFRIERSFVVCNGQVKSTLARSLSEASHEPDAYARARLCMVPRLRFGFV
jgi:hypothetical protein